MHSKVIIYNFYGLMLTNINWICGSVENIERILRSYATGSAQTQNSKCPW